MSVRNLASSRNFTKKLGQKSLEQKNENQCTSPRSSEAARSAGKTIVQPYCPAVDKCEIERMKQAAKITTEEDLLRIKANKEKAEYGAKSKAIERKQKILQKVAEENERKEQSALKVQVDIDPNALLSENDLQQHQHLESVTIINSLASRANALMFRDKQLIMSKEKKKWEENYEAKFDRLMEKECQMELKARKKNEEERKVNRIEGMKVIKKQIEERNRKKLREEEGKAIEAQKTLEQYKQYEKEELLKHQEAKNNVKERITEIDKSNKQIKKMKEEIKQREHNEELLAAAYLRKKAQQEEIHAKEEEQLKKQKEERIAKLRAQQEKSQDKQAAVDELRAKRAWETKEREIRREEKQQEERKRQLWENIDLDRKRQEQFKKEQEEIVNQRNLLEEQRNFLKNKEEILRRQDMEKKELEKKEIYQKLLKEQIAKNLEEKNRIKHHKKIEGIQDKKTILKEKIVVGKIKEHVIHQLKKHGVKEEYIKDIRNIE